MGPASNLMNFLASRPKGGVAVAVVAEVMPGVEELVRIFPAEEIGDSLADAAAALILCAQEDCEQRRDRLRYLFRWHDAQGQILAQRGITVQPHDVPDKFQHPAQIDAEQTGHPLAVMWEHTLRFRTKEHAQYMQGHQSVLQRQEKLIDLMMQREHQLQQALLDVLKAGKLRLNESEQSGGKPESSFDEARALAFDRLAQALTEHIVPVVAEKLKALPMGPSTAIAKPNGKANGQPKREAK